MVSSKDIDHETNLALAAGLAAGAIGVVFGTPREAATVAAISSIASYVIDDLSKSRTDWDGTQKRAVTSLLATAALFFVGRNNGFRISSETAVAALAGNGISLFMLRDKIPKRAPPEDKYRSHLFLAAVAAKILGGQGVPLFDTLLGNGAFLVTALNLAASQIKPQFDSKNKKWVDVVRLGAIFLFNQNSLNIGLPSTANQILNSLLLVEATKHMFN